VIALSLQPELPAEALEYGTANGFTVSKMAVGEGVRWKFPRTREAVRS
jgi:homoserine kinase